LADFKAVVFDMDGVLVDAREWHFEALNFALSYFGASISYDEHLARFDGLPTRVKLDMLSQDGRIPRRLHGLIESVKQRETQRLISVMCQPTFEHQALLQGLKAGGKLVGLASNSIEETIRFMMSRCQLIDYFDLIAHNKSVERPKPHPDIYLYAFNALGVGPEEAIVVEDNPNGIAAARASGARVMEVDSPSDLTRATFFDFVQGVT